MNKILLIAVATLFIASAAVAQENPKEQNYIEVSTRAEKQITPDEIYLLININELESKGKVTVEKQEADMIKALKGIKIDVEKNLTVKDMGSDLRKYFLRKNNILASKSYILKLGTASQAMSAMEVLNSIKISDISLFRTAVSPQLEKQTKDELLTEAAKKAKDNAGILATAVGSQAGEVIYIQNYYNFSQPSNFVLKAARAAVTEESVMYDSAPELEISKTSLSVNVTCRFRIK